MGGLLVVAFATLLVGCATESPKLPIAYVPQQNVQAIKGADAVPVEVTVEDLQPEEYESLNPFWEEQKQRFHVEDASDTVQRAAETEFKARGFKIGSGGALVSIQLDRFTAQAESGGAFWLTGTVRSHLSMRVRVRPQTGTARYYLSGVQVRPFTGKVLFSSTVRAEPDPISGPPSKIGLRPATHQLQKSLAEALKGLFADPAFTTAILAARQPTPKTP